MIRAALVALLLASTTPCMSEILSSATGVLDSPSDRIVGMIDNGQEIIRIIYDDFAIGGDNSAFLNGGVSASVSGHFAWRSTDTTSIGESWSVDLSVVPSPGAVRFVFDAGDEAGNNSQSMFTLDWGDTGQATVSDPANELTVVSNTAGAVTFHLRDSISFRSNNQTQWSVMTPGVDNLTISWVESPDSATVQNERLRIKDFVVEFPEAVSEPALPAPVPAPSGFGLACGALLSSVRRRWH